jgi:hypothetical protein
LDGKKKYSFDYKRFRKVNNLNIGGSLRVLNSWFHKLRIEIKNSEWLTTTKTYTFFINSNKSFKNLRKRIKISLPPSPGGLFFPPSPGF